MKALEDAIKKLEPGPQYSQSAAWGFNECKAQILAIISVPESIAWCSRCRANICKHNRCTDWTCAEACQECAPGPAPAEVTAEREAIALKEFTEYFVRNYPGPNTIIHRPEWHAPKIFQAAKRALAAAKGGGDKT